MSLLARFKAWLPTAGQPAAGLVPQLWESSWRAAAGLNPWTGKNNPSPVESATLGSIHRSIAVLADAMAACPKKVVQQGADGGATVLTGTDAARAIAAVSYPEWEASIFNLAMTGNAFFVIHLNDRGGPRELEQVASWRVAVEVDQATGEHRYRVQPDPAIASPEATIPATRMVHLKYRVTGRHRLLGISPLVDVAPSMALTLEVRDTGRSIYTNLAAPSLYLTHPKRLSVEARGRLKDAWMQGYGGDKKGSVAVLEEGLTVNTVELSKLLDQQYVELTQAGVREASRVFGIPPILLAEDSTTNFSTAAEAMRSFYSATLGPFAVRVADALGQVLIPAPDRAAGTRVVFDTSAAVRGHGAELADFLSRLLNSGSITANESRALIGMAPIANGDALRVPSNTIEAGYWESEYRPGAEPAEPSTDEKTMQAAKMVGELALQAVGTGPEPEARKRAARRIMTATPPAAVKQLRELLRLDSEAPTE